MIYLLLLMIPLIGLTALGSDDPESVDDDEEPDEDPVPDEDPDPGPVVDPNPDPGVDPDPGPVIDPTPDPDPVVDPDPDPDPDPVVDPDSDEDPDPASPITRTGHFVSEDLFGANAIYSVNTDQGTPTETLESSIEEFELDTFRFPAGQAEPDGVDGEDYLDITQLTEDGELRPELTDFMDNIEGGVTLVLPVVGASVEEYGEGMSEWAEKVMNEYGDKIDAFEIGNEYWARMGETEYGQKANIAIQELASGISAADAGDPDILVQMATPTGQSEFHSSVDDRGYMDRLTDANNTIIDQLDEDSRTQVDGVIEHYYWNDFDFPFDHDAAERRHIDADYEVWEERFERELDLYITEWNVKTTNTTCNGLRSLPIMTELVENMVEMDVDVGHVWPINHNTINDIGGSFDDPEIVTDDQGRVIENVRGAMFDLMSTNLPGKELVEIETDDLPDSTDLVAFEGDGELIIYIRSYVFDKNDFTLDVSDLVADFQSATGVQVGYDPDTSDGMAYVPGEGVQPSASIEIDGEPYYLTEHDTQAELTDYTYDDPRIDISLRPFEVLQLTIPTA
ncbi:hypothetical protein M8756_00450 [Lutimaribacter sp. EGI FJ00015]|uniref:Uncharacterized protein n=1 Tax=Lutimaribacter degradans TaxID=2945989 RepID=A0ACC5ZTL4_9RHOB|nr:hypothetical protein [Lutimaribacter sp. EGI FJ00013]MCM2561288.1 hypothetical protein [Lutimaribacter sp. EGI FJ00013]MCO0611761.1 hypothetical protein [Lutimaribacter sp. EGI FJ00015]MCO0635117.1 hypothetical protein [Lutimaribacter sp. EGI FJ00014]